MTQVADLQTDAATLLLQQHNVVPGRALTEMGNGERFVDQHGADFRYCEQYNGWLAWDGMRWRRDRDRAVIRAAKATVRTIYAEVAATEDPDRRKALASWAAKSESARSLRELLFHASADLTVLPEDLDRDPWLLNVRNGTIDLRTGQLQQPHRRGDLITKLVPVDYAPDAQAPTWEKFLTRAFADDTELVDFAQRHAGYCLTGTVGEKIFMVIWGPTDAGKSKFVEALLALFGRDYSQVMRDEDLLVLRRPAGGNNDGIADLQGARLATLSETPDGVRLNVSLIKSLTGNSQVTAMRKYERPITFQQTAKFLLETNHRPRISDTDDAIWGRVKILPFNVKIPEAEQDKELGEKFQAELPGILTWAVRGCLAWQHDGLNPPEKVQAATEDYRRHEDTFGEFLTTCCVQGPGAYAYSSDLHAAYIAYTGDRMSPKAFGDKLRANEFDAGKVSGRRVWLGLALTSENAPGGQDG